MQISFKSPYIIKYFRDSNNNRIIERIHTDEFSPYFYVDKTEDIPQDSRILKTEDASKKSLFGKELKKITVRNVYDVIQLRNSFYSTYEADIRFTDRFFIDRIKEVPNEFLRKCYFDLETSAMPSVQMDNESITCIGVYDNYTTKYYTFIISDKDTTEEREGHIIYHCINEYMVLDRFIDHVKEFDYDMLIAHNAARFDFPVLIGRIQRLSVMNYGRLSPTGVVKRDNSFGEWKTTIENRILFDFMGAKTNFGIKGGIRGLLDGRDITVKGADGEDRIVRIKRWSLEYLAQFVGMKKGEYSKIQSLKDMIKYNRQDIQIMVELDKFFNVTEYYHNMQQLLGCSFENTYSNTTMIDNFLLKRYNQFAFPTKPQRGQFDNDITIKGATVDDPVSGLYPKIYVIDQTSLYPTVVISANMSLETACEDGEIKLGNGISFTTKKKGIIADAVEFLLEIRLRYKELAKTEKDPHVAQMYGLISDGYKILLVSFYGALLFRGFRLYDYKIAESIPYMGRVIKEHVRDLCKKHGYTVVYGDTDSSMIVPTETAIPIEQLIDIINLSFDGFSKGLGMPTHRFHIELDKVFSPIILSDVKKRYVGFLEKKGKRIFKSVGFESVRRDTAPITEQMQETIFKIVLAGGKKEDVMTYVNKIKEDIKNGEYKLRDLMLPKGFSKSFDKFKVDSPWVKGARYSNKNLGTTFDQFSDVGIFYIKYVPEGKPFTEVVAIDTETEHILKGFKIDWPVQIDKLIDHKVNNFITMMKWDDTKQKTLFEF